MGYNCENSTLTFVSELPCRTLLASHVLLGIEPRSFLMRGRCSDKKLGYWTGVVISALGYIDAICAYVGQ